MIPNIVDAERGARPSRATPPSFALPERFLLFVGKLEENKGARAAGARGGGRRAPGLPLVVLGEGTLAHALKMDAAEAGVPLLLRGWAEREDVLRTLARATALVFPSLWPEPLSRVLLEALALGTPIAAMDTGGTREILGPGERAAGARRGGARRARCAARADERACATTCARAARERAGPSRPRPWCRATRRCTGGSLRVALLAAAAHPLHAAGRHGARGVSSSRATCRRGASRRCSSRARRTRAGAFPGEVIERAVRRSRTAPRRACSTGRSATRASPRAWARRSPQLVRAGAIDVVDAQGLTALGYGAAAARTTRAARAARDEPAGHGGAPARAA